MERKVEGSAEKLGLEVLIPARALAVAQAKVESEFSEHVYDIECSSKLESKCQHSIYCEMSVACVRLGD